MRIIRKKTPALILVIAFASSLAFAPVIYETTSPYHHIRVVDQGGLRSLLFDNATQSQISIQSPLKGHFEYTEYFHMAWLWNARLTNVLMIGLGGATAQQAFVHYYPDVIVRTVEIDPVVVQVASNYFSFRESKRQKTTVEDGRTFLRRSPERYDLIILDAYVHSRYGSAIPQHLVTKEFFELTRDHLTTNGVVAYNVIGTLNAWNADVVGAVYRTLNSVFPQVYIFKTTSTRNLVLIATKSSARADLNGLRFRANFLAQNGLVKLPAFRTRVDQFHAQAPPNAARSPILTDDYAPVEGLAASQDKAR